MCAGCKRIFWRGPKFKNTEEYLLDILRQQDPIIEVMRYVWTVGQALAPVLVTIYLQRVPEFER